MIRQVNEELANSYAWVNANKSSLNIDKTNFMLCMPNYSSHCADHIVINQTRIHEVKETKVSWRYHRQQAQVVCTYQVRQQKKCQRYWYHTEIKKSFQWWGLFITVPHICISLSELLHTCMGQGIWYPSKWSYCTAEQIYADNQWCTTKNRTNMDEFYIENNILTVKHIFDYNIGLFMFKYVNNMTPDVLIISSEMFLIYISTMREMPHRTYSV